MYARARERNVDSWNGDTELLFTPANVRKFAFRAVGVMSFEKEVA